MRNGQRLATPAPLSELRERAAAQLARLPVALRGLLPYPPYPVSVSGSLRELAAQVHREFH